MLGKLADTDQTSSIRNPDENDTILDLKMIKYSTNFAYQQPFLVYQFA